MASKHAVVLDFEQIKCSRCGNLRVRGVMCPDCGERPKEWEVNAAVMRRRAAVASIRAVLDGASLDAENAAPLLLGADPTLSPSDIFAHLGSWVGRFFQSLSAASRTEFREISPLLQAVSDLIVLVHQASHLSAARPMARAVELGQDLVSDCVSVVEGFLSALEASHPLEAQQRVTKAQAKLDAAAELAEELNIWLERCEAVYDADGVQQALGALLADASEVRGVSTLIDLDAVARIHLDALTGRVLDVGTGVQYAIQETFASLFLDQKAFESKFRTALGIYLSSETLTRALFSDPDFCADLDRLQLEMFDAGVATQRTIMAATVERQATRAAVGLHATLVEVAGRLLCSPLLVATGHKTRAYSKLRHDNATELLRTAGQHSELEPLLAGLEPGIRLADAHLNVVHHEDGGLTTDNSKGSRVYDGDHFVDLTFEAMESVLAGIAAVQTCRAALGLPMETGAGLRDLGLTSTEIASLVLGGFGYDVQVAASDDPPSLVVQILSGEMNGMTPALGAALMLIGPGVFTHVLLECADQRWTCPTSRYEAFWEAPDEYEKQIALIRIQRAWTAPTGESWLSDDMLTRWIAGSVVQTFGESLQVQMARLRRLRDLAHAVGTEDLANGVSAAIRVARLSGGNQKASAAELAELQRLVSIAETEHKPEFI